MDVLDWVRALFALFATLALIGLAALAARRFGMVQIGLPNAQRRINVTERLMLDPRRQVVIVRVDEEEHVLLLSPFGEKKLGRQPAKPLPAPAESRAEAAP